MKKRKKAEIVWRTITLNDDGSRCAEDVMLLIILCSLKFVRKTACKQKKHWKKTTAAIERHFHSKLMDYP